VRAPPVEFHRAYMGELAKAVIEEVMGMRSCFGWRLPHDWEWAKGYTDRFGVTWVDFESPEDVVSPTERGVQPRVLQAYDHLLIVQEHKTRFISRI
jgi:beta-glucosidase